MTQAPVYLSKHPLCATDAATLEALRPKPPTAKHARRGADEREAFDAWMDSVPSAAGTTFERDTVGGITGTWVHPPKTRPGQVILYLHGGWFNSASTHAYRNFVGHIATKARAHAFIPDYRLAPEDPFPAAVRDVYDCYRSLEKMRIPRVAIVGDSAGGNLALVLALLVAEDAYFPKPALVAVAAFSPITDMTLSGSTYTSRSASDLYLSRSQVAGLVRAYLGPFDARHPMASPLNARFAGLPSIRIHVGDDEVLLDDSLRYVERAASAGVDAKLDVWMGMPHGFFGRIGTLEAAEQALQATTAFLSEKLLASNENARRLDA